MHFAGLIFCIASWATPPAGVVRPAEIVDVKTVDPSLHVQMMYFSKQNFVGKTVNGYKANVCYLSRSAAQGLKTAQARLKENAGSRKLTLLLNDCYRPVKAVRHFMLWAQNAKDSATKPVYYPETDKSRLIPEGYIAKESGHSRASTVDLTMAEIGPNGEIKALDMGTIVDYFGEKSATSYPDLSKEQRANRDLLLRVMSPEFSNYSKEWWHFTLKNEPYKSPFDFNVE